LADVKHPARQIFARAAEIRQRKYQCRTTIPMVIVLARLIAIVNTCSGAGIAFRATMQP